MQRYLSFVSLSYLITGTWQAYTGPFTLLSYDGLAGTADPSNNFGPSDHMVMCKGSLSFIDIDNTTGFLYRSKDNGQTWTQETLYFTICPDGLPLIPRDAGYTVAVTVNPANNGDRIVIVGGDSADADVWVSDDCGMTFSCFDTPEEWTPRDFPILLTPPEAEFEAQPLFMGGGKTNNIYSVGLFQSLDGGQTWTRPVCSAPGTCTYPYGTDPDYYVFPNPPTMGKLAADTRTLYFFDDWTNGDPDLSVFYLNSSNYGTGWKPVPGADLTNAFGRKVWIGSAMFGSTAGCWFSTDYDTEDLYASPKSNVNSMNSFSTARSPNGPWTLAPITAPWSPRASAVILGLGSTAIVAGGLSFSNGSPTYPTFGDVWQVDAGVCLLDANGNVCSNHGHPNINTVKCICDPGWGGDVLCGSCTVNKTYGPSCTLCPTSIDGSSCNSASGGGYCDSTKGCVCTTGYTGPSCNIPPPPPANNSPSSLSPGAATAVSFTVITIAAAGVFIYFSGGPRAAISRLSLNVSSYLTSKSYSQLSSKASPVSTSSASSSSASSTNVSSVSKLSKDQAAARLLVGNGSSGSTGPGTVSGYQISSGSYGSYQ